MKNVISLGSYKGVSVKKEEVIVTRDEILARVNEVLESKATQQEVTRPAQLGDTAVINFKGFIDDVAFEGGEGEDFPLLLGSHSFIDDFEDQLVGAAAGSHVTVNVTFPLQYQAVQYAGKKARFEVDVNKVIETVIPEFDDAFVSEVTEGAVKDTQTYLASMGNVILAEKQEQAAVKQENNALKKVIDSSELDVTDEMISAEVKDVLNGLRQQLAQSGYELQQYLQAVGMTQKQLLDQVRPEADFRVRSRLVLLAIAEAENIEVSDEDLEEELNAMAQGYGMPPERMRELIGEERMDAVKFDIKLRKAYMLVAENMVLE